METCYSNRVPKYRLKWLCPSYVCAVFIQKIPMAEQSKNKVTTLTEMLEVKLFLFRLQWIHPWWSPTGLLCLSGLIVYVHLFAYFFIHSQKPTQLFCVFHSNAPFWPQLAAPRIGQPAGIWKRRSWKVGAHSVEHSDGTGCWRWGEKALTSE